MTLEFEGGICIFNKSLLRFPQWTTFYLSGHHSFFSIHVPFPQVFKAIIHGFFLQRERWIHTITLIFTGHYVNSWFTNLSNHIHMSGGTNDLPKFLPISFFRRVSRCFGVFGTFGPPIRKILVYTGMLPCPTLSYPFLASSYATSYLVLISFWVLTMPWILYPISLFRRVSRFSVF